MRKSICLATASPEKSWLRKSHLESLGSKMIEGVNCEGKIFTHTVPANSKMGNARPLESSTEIWIAKDLMLPVLSVTEHPVMGRSVQRFTNIRTGVEPDPSLFRLPEGFKVVDK